MIFLALFGFMFIACSDDNEISAREQTINNITADSWIAEQVIHATDGDLTFQYENFSIRFTKGNATNYDGEYYVINGSNAFTQPYGKWSLNSELTTIMLDNGLDLDFTMAGNEMTLDFTVPAPDNGRVGGLSGHFIFSLKHL